MEQQAAGEVMSKGPGSGFIRHTKQEAMRQDLGNSRILWGPAGEEEAAAPGLEPLGGGGETPLERS